MKCDAKVRTSEAMSPIAIVAVETTCVGYQRPPGSGHPICVPENSQPSFFQASRRRLKAGFQPWTVALLYACATLQFARFYVSSTISYLNLSAYLAGKERLPFQARVLPAVLMRVFYRSPLAQHAAGHKVGAFTPDKAPLFLISLVSVVVAGVFLQRLYSLLSQSGTLHFLVYPVFLFTLLWTYVVHLEANFAYPYDMMAVAFFSAGLFFIYARRFLPLLLVILVGTFNRETTLFLIGLYLLDATTVATATSQKGLGQRFSLSQIEWWKATLLVVAWLVVKLALTHTFSHNNSSENYVRLGENFGRLKPRLWPALLNICGYTIPLILLFQHDLQPVRFRNYLWILPVWFATMFYTGVIVETRIYGELCPYAAVALVLIMERRLSNAFRSQQGWLVSSRGHNRLLVRTNPVLKV